MDSLSFPKRTAKIVNNKRHCALTLSAKCPVSERFIGMASVEWRE